jgi:hypothetical protein
VRKRPKTKGVQQQSAPRTAEETREALDFCFEDVSSLRMVGAAPLSDLMSSTASRRTESGASREPGRSQPQRWNIVLLVLVVVAMAAVIAATLLR